MGLDWVTFIIVFSAGVGSSVAAGIILFEYRSYRNRRMGQKTAKKQWNTDLSYELLKFCDDWNEYAGTVTPGISLRTSLIDQAAQIRERALSEFVSTFHERAIKKRMTQFLVEARKLLGADDATWSTGVIQRVDTICKDLERLVRALRK